MKKIQKKVNHAYITKRRNEGAIGFSLIPSLLLVEDPLVKEKRMKVKRIRSELNRKRHEREAIDEEEFF